ncbi:MAG TPA: endopeptidase La [Ignavibacteria bacterium]|nr:endopeptidase La [Bacteroidota bacterium]HRI85480.1 endopeptidase La [Ignavibacteria bacterium]HRK00195.1 endopeptidase La [Ignavibacteria bacterium]
MAKSKEDDFNFLDDEDNIDENSSEVIYQNQTNIPDLKVAIPDELPVLPLKDMVVFPYMMFPILAGRESTIAAINNSLEKDKFIMLVSQLDEKIEEPTFENLNKTGTVAKIIQVLRLPNGLIKVLVDGLVTAKVKKYKSDKYISAEVEVLYNPFKKDTELEALIRQATKLFTDYVNTNRSIPQETLVAFENIKEPDRKLYYIASTISADVSKKQKILEMSDIHKQFYEILYILGSEMEVLNVEKEIDAKIYQTMQKNQRKFIVQEQIRILQDELGDGMESDPDLIKIREQIEASGMPEPVLKKAMDEFNKLKKIPSMSPDHSVIRNFLDWMVSVPWNIFTEDNFDLINAKKILDEDHYGLEKAKDRILELMAVLKLLHDKNIKKSPKGQILCFVGPPGVGKTSLGKSIARAINRNFVRISVGGVRDEAEIRGHRRTYIGSMPGKIIQAMKKAGSVNPVILIDEIDKMSSDFRGDPSSAMLEVLDPEQNSTFNDHYLDVDYDLSNVLFITTANVYYNIPLPLLDRMEIIEMRSYLDFEKLQIAKKHIIPKEILEHGLTDSVLKIPDQIILLIIREYTREAGVRNLEREISSVIRKVTREIVEKGESGPGKKIIITEEHVRKFLGVQKYKQKIAGDKTSDNVGSVVGLAWTSMGGDILHVDVNIMKGANKFILTGKLGDIMKESAQAGFSYIKSNASKFNIPESFFKEKEIHIHLPEGAIPKDGPSAGITMIMAMISAITKNPVRPDVAMTGEITLRGNVLPIGGLNEKLLAAVRSGIKTVLIPKDNEKDLIEVPEEILSKLKIIPVEKVEDGIPFVFKNKKIFFKK